MLIVSSQTANAMTPHTTGGSWVMFVQCASETSKLGPIWIDGIAGDQLGTQLDRLDRFCAYPTFLIGLIETTMPKEATQAIREQYAGKALHHFWHEPTADLLAYIQHAAQAPIRSLLEQTQPGALYNGTVDIDELAKILGCSCSTIRRMVASDEIPYMRLGRALRFVPADVFASLQQRR